MDKKALNKMAMKAGVVFVFLQIFVKGISFISTPIYTRMVTTAQYGDIRIYESWLLILAPIVSLNLYRCGDQAKFEFGEDKYYGSISSIQFLCYLVISGFCLILFTLKEFIKRALGITDVMFYIMLLFFFSNSSLELMRRREKQMLHYKMNMVTTVLTMLPATFFSILFIWLGKINQYSDYLVELRTIGFYGPQLIGGIIIFFLISFQGKKIVDKKVWKYALTFCIPLIPEMISIQIMNQSDKIMIQSLVNSEVAGIYSLGTTVSWIVWVLEDGIWNAWQPWIFEKISRNESEDVKSPWVILMHGLGILSLLLVLFGPEIIYILGDNSYKDAMYLIAPLNASMLFHFYNNCYSAIISYNKQTKKIASNTIMAMLVNVFLNYICILKWGYIAAAYTTAISYFFLMICQAVSERKITGNNVMPLGKTIKICIFYFTVFELSNILYNFSFLFRYFVILILVIFAIIKLKSLKKSKVI